MKPLTRRCGLLALLMSAALVAHAEDQAHSHASDKASDQALGPAKPQHAAAVVQTLEQALRQISNRYGWNYVLGPQVDLSTRVDEAIRSEDELKSWLNKSGISLTILDSGDRDLRRLNTAEVSLAPLPVTAEFLAGAGAPLRENASSTIIGADDIINLNDTRLDQLFARAANVFGSGDEYYVRGVASGGDLNTLGNAAAVVGKAPLAGVVLANLPLSTWDTAQAGFERGSHSASVVGPFASFAGRISIAPVKPKFASERALQVGLTELGDTQTSLLANQVLVAEELALRISIDHQSLAGTLDDPGTSRSEGLGDQYNYSRNTTARAAALWEPAAWPELRVSLDVLSFDGSAGPQRIAALDPFGRVGRGPPFRKRDVDGQLGSLSGSWESSNSGLFSLDLVASRGVANLTANRLLVNTLDPPDPLVDQERDRLGFGHLNWHKIWGNTKLGAGISLGRNENREIYLREGRRWQLQSRLYRKTAAISIDTALSSRWHIQAGIRYARDQLQRSCASRGELETANPSTDCLQVLGLLLTPSDGQFEAFAERYSTTSPELALAFRPSNNSEYFLRLAEGYNAGGAVSDATFAGEPFWIFYDPERSRSAEFGWRGELGPVNLSATTFYTQLDQQWQAVQGGGALLADITNVGSSRNRGLELDGRWQFAQGHQLSFSLGWLDTRFENYLPFENDAQLEPADGNQFPGAPDFSGSLNWRSNLPGGWQIGAGVSFHDSVQANANNPTSARIPAVALTDIRIAWKRAGVTIALSARNLFDRDYQLTTPNVIRRNQRIDYLPGRPRNVALTLQYFF